MAKERTVTCPVCEKIFTTKIYNKKVCSKECARVKDLDYANKFYFSKKEDILNNCKVCGEEYVKRNNSLTCSKECSRKNSNRIKTEYAKRNGDLINERLRKKRKTSKKMRDREKRQREKKKEWRKTWEKENEEELRKYRKEYWSSEEGKKKRKEWRDDRLKNDPVFKLRMNISSLIHEVMRKKGFSKKSKSAKILGCTYEVLYSHLVKSFENNYNMPWKDEYFSLVHIDHIVPMSSAQTEEEVYELNHYSNLQFLYFRDNIIKSDKMDWELDLEDTLLYQAIEELEDE